MKNIFKRKLTTEDAAEYLYDYTRAISTGIVSDTEELLALGMENSDINLTKSLFFQYIMYRTNLILWSKLQDELLYGEVSKKYYSLCSGYLGGINSHQGDASSNVNVLGRKLFSEFDQILKDNYHERIKVINSQITVLYYYNKGVPPTIEEKLAALSVALKIEDNLLDEIENIVDKI